MRERSRTEFEWSSFCELGQLEGAWSYVEKSRGVRLDQDPRAPRGYRAAVRRLGSWLTHDCVSLMGLRHRTLTKAPSHSWTVSLG